MPIVSGGGSGGAPPSVLTATVRLTSAEILALDSAPKTLVAGVAGSAIVALSQTIVVLPGVTPYTEASSLRVFVGASWATAGWGTLHNATANPLSQATAKASINDLGPALEGDMEPLAALDGQPLRMDSAGVITDGDGTAVVTTCYYLAPLA